MHGEVESVVESAQDVTGPTTDAPVVEENKVAPPPPALVPSPPSAEAPDAPAEGDTPPVDLDADGMPWDARIHSSGKTRYKKKGPNGNADTWVLKKGVDRALVEQVRAETPAAEAELTPDDALAALEAMQPVTYASVCQRITSNLAPKGKLDPMAMGALLGGLGLTGLPDLAAKPQLLPQVNAKLDELLA